MCYSEVERTLWTINETLDPIHIDKTNPLSSDVTVVSSSPIPPTQAA
jgi:hypothetical protein